MSSRSPRVPRSATRIYGGIVLAVTTITVGVFIFHGLWGTGNKTEDEGNSEPGRDPNVSQPSINQDARDDFSTPVQSTTPHPVGHSAGDEGQLSISVLSHAPPTTSDLHGEVGSEEPPSIALSQGSLNFQISETNTTVLRNANGQFTKGQRHLACEYIANSHITLSDNDDKKHVLTKSIITLRRAEAVFRDYKNKKKIEPCLEGTRVGLLQEMADYVTSPSESRMYILSGLAGIGKSTVAYTTASRAADLNLLGASFVFSRDEANRNNAKRFFATIAYQLCLYNEAFSKAIGGVLETTHESLVTTSNPQIQLTLFILDPLRSIVQSYSRPILIFVDALDECDRQDAVSILTGLRQLVRELPPFRVILTTRPQLYFDRLCHKLVHLQDMEDKVIDGDTRLYLDHNLSLKQVQKRYPMQQWCASDEEIDSLVCAAGRLFVIASTAVRYILDKRACNPAAQMQKLLHTSAQGDTPINDLDRFYTVILRDVVSEDHDDVRCYQLIVGTILFVQHPLPISILTHLIGIGVQEIRVVLDKLQSVILLGDDDVPQIYHQSFPEYLTDQLRCKDPYFRIDPRICHTQIVTRCFEMMNKHLRYNILDFSDVARFMRNEDGLEEDGITDEQIQEKIPQQLRYACVYWANHLEFANIEDEGLIYRLEMFVHEHMLHWFEVLSLVGNLYLAHLAIDIGLQLLKSFSDLHQLLSDGVRFIERFYGIIKRSALHTYYSALLFAPTDSQLYRRYIKEAMHNIYAIEGGSENWDALIVKLRHGDNINVVKFSLDSSLFMSYRPPGNLKIWNAVMGQGHTGTSISTITGRKLAVANDFSTIASSKDNTTVLYSLNGSPSGARINTSSKVRKLALSSESGRVAAALSDGTVWLWESRNAELIDSFDGFEDSKWSKLEFSPNGTRLAYSSANGIIKLQDGISGRFIADLRCGSWSLKFEFSADSSRVATVSHHCRLTLWNSESGRLISDVGEVGWRGWAISANGSLVATSHAYKVTLWSDSLVQIKVLGVAGPNAMTFSMNSLLALATKKSVKLYNVKTHSLIHSLPFDFSCSTLAFSPDCTRLSASCDSSINLWDIRGIETFRPPSKDATRVTAVALSRDCSRLACGYEDGRIELWGTTPTKRRIASHLAHKKWVCALGFGPSGGLFASGSGDGTIKLWDDKNGWLRGTVQAPVVPDSDDIFCWGRNGLWGVTFSNSVLVGATYDKLTLWSLETLSLIHTSIMISGDKVSIAENNALIAIARGRIVYLLDAMSCRTISTFNVDDEIHIMAFLPDNSHLVVQLKYGSFLLFNLINKHITKGATLEHLIQLPNISFWRGVPIWHCQDRDSRQHYFAALFSQHKSPVPVLWIPKCIDMTVWTQGSSMIALGCRDGRVILLRLPTGHVS